MKPTLLICFNLFFLASTAQDKNAFYALDSNMNPATLETSKYLLWIHQKNDSNWQWDYYYTWGPLIKSYSYADHDGQVMNGRFYLYNRMGNLDSTGEYDHGKKNGSFYRLKSITDKKIVTVSQYDYVLDSLMKYIHETGDSDKKMLKDTGNTRESYYEGGQSQWTSYLSKNLQYPDRARDRNIHGQVQLGFMINSEGIIKDIHLLKSVEYSLDQESVRVLNESGKWNPGLIDGQPVKTYKTQPVDF
jgi:periplasmic protein TonB